VASSWASAVLSGQVLRSVAEVQHSTSNNDKHSTAARCALHQTAAQPFSVAHPLKCFQTLYTLHTQQLLTVNVSNHASRSRDGRRTGRARCVTRRFDLSPRIPQQCIVDDSRDHPTTTTNQPSQGASNFGDSSGQLFSMYSKAADEEDDKMVERWQKDADGILIFVSPRVAICLSLHINWNTIDRSILRCSRCPPRCYRPGPETKQSGYLRFLPRQHLSGSRRPKCNTLIYSFPRRQTSPILSSEIFRLGEHSLVLELGDECQLCFMGDIVTSMGTSISPSSSACSVQSRKASANACFLCRGR
jgi:hypothetical protein